jgi:hypothetical protein
MEEKEKVRISDSEFITNIIKEELEAQEHRIISYVNKYMTQEERDKHGNNIWSYLVRPESIESLIRLRIIADGRNP